MCDILNIPAPVGDPAENETMLDITGRFHPAIGGSRHAESVPAWNIHYAEYLGITHGDNPLTLFPYVQNECDYQTLGFQELQFNNAYEGPDNFKTRGIQCRLCPLLLCLICGVCRHRDVEPRP